MLSNFSSYLAPFLVFGLVVFIHELGHFLAAKLTGVYAPVFSLGWGSRLFGVRRGETDYRVSMFPIGGFVRMATREDDSMAGIEGGRNRGDLDGETPAPEQPSALWDENSMAPFGPRAVPQNRWIESKGTAARVFIMSSGIIMNILLALVVNTGVLYVYGTEIRPAVIDSVVVGKPAANAGLVHGDKIVAVNGGAIKDWNDAVEHISVITSGTLTVDVQRGTERFSRSITPEVAELTDSATGAKQKVGRIGIQVMRDSLERASIGFGESVTLGARGSWFIAKQVVFTLKGLFTGSISPKNLGGPIAIARESVRAAKSGAENLWFLVALLSINIAILNLVPIPVLDGGQILLVLAERIKGSAFSSGVREGFARVGVLAVLCLFLLVMFNDVKAWLFS